MHLCVIISLGLAPMSVKRDDMMLVVNSGPMEKGKVELTLPEAFSFSDQPTAEIGSNSVQGELAAVSMAPVISDVSAVPNHLEAVPIDNGRIEINNLLQTATGQHYAENLAVKGTTGEGATGAVRTIDRITHEILLSLEERKTLVGILAVRRHGQLDPAAKGDSRSLQQDLSGAGNRRSGGQRRFREA